MKLNETQKQSLSAVKRQLESQRLAIVHARSGRRKHIISSRLVRPEGPAAVLCSAGGLEKISEQYRISKLTVITPSSVTPGADTVHIWPVEALQDQRTMRAQSYGLVIIDVRHEQLERALSAARNLLRPGGKLLLWHHGELRPGVLEIEG